jgi:hypothetical protein
MTLGVFLGGFFCLGWQSQGISLDVLHIPYLGYGWIYRITLGPLENNKQCEMTIINFPTCICMNFIMMIKSSLGKWGKQVHFKHMQYILQHVMLYGRMETIIHYSR